MASTFQIQVACDGEDVPDLDIVTTDAAAPNDALATALARRLHEAAVAGRAVTRVEATCLASMTSATRAALTGSGAEAEARAIDEATAVADADAERVEVTDDQVASLAATGITAGPGDETDAGHPDAEPAVQPAQ